MNKYPHLFVEIDPEYGDIFISNARKWVKNPVTGEKETIAAQWSSLNPIFCPSCHSQGHMKITATRKHVIISCHLCKQHSWHEKKEEVKTPSIT